ncbi:MAG TPA: hypothetical protein VJW77_09915 [Terriglobia bacterium]|nr:hypothetical protein [Terriglobia bacterium]
MKKNSTNAIKHALLILVPLLSVGALLPQESPTLVAKAVVPLTGTLASLGPLMEPSRCDPDGGVYLRVYSSPQWGLMPVIRVSTDGKEAAEFRIDQISDPPLKEGVLQDFAVDLRGNVYGLVFLSKTNESYVARFQRDGQFDSAIKLDSKVFPTALAVFPSREFLMSGIVPGSAGLKDGKPFTGIFDLSGELVRSVRLPGDVKLGSGPAGAKKDNGKKTSEPRKFFDAQADPAIPLTLGAVDVGDDGNAYLMRASQPPTVYVVSPSGDVLRQWRLKAPSPDFFPVAMKVSSGRIALAFQENSVAAGSKPAIVYSVYDSLSGDFLAEYGEGDGVVGALACYSPDEFTFVGRDKEHPPAIVEAVPR